MHRLGKLSYGLVSVVVAVLLISSTALAAGGSQWPFAGADLQNSRYQDTENKIKVKNVANLGVQWQFNTGGDVSATPAVDDNNVYVNDWAGNLYAVDRKTGAQVWSHKISDYTGVMGDYSRTTPAIDGNKLIFGDQSGKLGVPASVMAVNKNTGALLWKTLADAHPFSIITQSAVVTGKDVYVGVASFEELLSALIPGYLCCSFRGSVLDLNVNTGQIVWKTYTMPAGFSGGAVWGSTPAVDNSRGLVYVDSGNNYSISQSAQTCLNAPGADPKACLAGDYFDSVLALDQKTGAIRWGYQALSSDAWNVNCLASGVIPGINPVNPGQCPQNAGPDWDFGQGPALFTVHTPGRGKPRDLVGAGQKSGQYWALNPDTGAVVWETQVGPGGITGGLQWGSATDGKRIYVAESNSLGQPWALVQNGIASSVVVTSGFWSALDPATGKILWQTADPQGAGDWSPVSVANDVVYACSGDATGTMRALNGATGNILWNYPTNHACYGGAAISKGTVYWGTGYSQAPAQYQMGSKFYAFGLP